MNPHAPHPDHARYAEWDSAYVLGALAPAERREYEAHLESCERCRRSVGELASLPGLLARLSAERGSALLDDAADAQAGPRPGLRDALRLEGRRRRIRRTRVRVALAAAAVALVVLAAILVPMAVVRPMPGTTTFAFETVSDLPVAASATLTPVGWGTRIDLDCRYEAVGASGGGDGWPYALYVVDRDGGRSELSSWRAHPGKTARLEAGTVVELDDIAALEIRAIDSGEVLMRGRAD